MVQVTIGSTSATIGDVQLNEDTDEPMTFGVGAGSTLTVMGSMSGAGDITMQAGGTGVLTNTNIYAGTTVSGGTLLLSNAAAIPASGVSTSVSAGAGLGFDPSGLSGNQVTLTFTASGNVDAYASDTLVAGSWSLVASAISISPAVVEDNVGAAKRFYVLVPTGSGNSFP